MKNKLLDTIKFIVYFIVSFDTDYLFIQKGGEQSTSKSSEQAEEANSNNSKNISNKIEEIEETEELEQGFIKEIFNKIKDAIIISYKWMLSGVMTWVVIPVMFASVAPSVPFLGVMAALAATMKYIIWHFRKL